MKYSPAQLQQAANEVVLAMDGRISRANAVLVARAVLRWVDEPAWRAGLRRDTDPGGAYDWSAPSVQEASP